jgi:hypothetical protein
MSRKFAEVLRDHKQAIFDHFKTLIPALDSEFPEYNIVVRPHPTENQKIYHDIAARCQRVRVTNEGNVVPWLMAANALVHNGCTTGVEAFAMGVPAVSYRETINEDIDDTFYRLPNRLSQQCFDFEQLRAILHKILAGEIGVADGNEREALLAHYLTAQDGPLACERMVDVLEKITANRSELPPPPLNDRLAGRSLSYGRRLIKWAKSYLPGTHAPPEFHRHRYPGISLDELRARILRFQEVLGDNTEIKSEKISEQIFKISA